jgi:hypothetical protein
MTKAPQRSGNRLSRPERRPAVEKLPTRRFPIQREIQKLQQALDAFNERIEELEGEGHRSLAKSTSFAACCGDCGSCIADCTLEKGVLIERVDGEQFAAMVVEARVSKA